MSDIDSSLDNTPNDHPEDGPGYPLPPEPNIPGEPGDPVHPEPETPAAAPHADNLPADEELVVTQPAIDMVAAFTAQMEKAAEDDPVIHTVPNVENVSQGDLEVALAALRVIEQTAIYWGGEVGGAMRQKAAEAMSALGVK